MTPENTHLASALEELIVDLEQMTAAERAELRAVVKAYAPGFVARSDTAAFEARRAALEWAGAVEFKAFTSSEAPDWLRLGMVTAYAEWLKEQASTCRHAPDADRGDTAVAASSRPGLVVCGDCCHLLGRSILSCDGCGCDCAGEGATFNVLSLTRGALTFTARACQRCSAVDSQAVGGD
jgi:hypothetical protein